MNRLRRGSSARDYARMKRIMPLPLWLALVLVSPPGAQSADAPRRVASFNLCADQLVVALADPEQIAGLSPYAANPGLSVVADEARRYRKLDWQAESTIVLQPDLVLVGPNDRSVTRRMLAAQGLRVVAVDFVTDLESARAQIRYVAALLGHPDRGEKLVAALDAARTRLASRRSAAARTAIVVERGGYAQGPASLAATLLAEAGLGPPPGAPKGYGGFIPLEKLLLLKADLVFVKDPPSAPNDQGALYLMHPALQALYPPERRIALPTRLTMCGGPALVAAFDYLADALSSASP
jgi:iron complex transport system substrate-binding protein